MDRTHCALALVALYVGMAHSFSWEIFMGFGNRLEFIDINGTVTHIQNMPSSTMYFPTFDPVHNRVLFIGDRDNLYSFDVAKMKTEIIISNRNTIISDLAYDPATDLLFWVDDVEIGNHALYSISLKSEFNKNQSYEKYLIQSDTTKLRFLAVDSCGGFIYWKYLYSSGLYRIRFDRTEMKVVINDIDVRCMTIDNMSQKIYWADANGTIKSVDLNGKNIRTIIRPRYQIYDLTVSKDFIYCAYRDNGKNAIMQIPKNSPHESKILVQRNSFIIYIAANYDIEDITRENQNCDTLKNLKPNKSVSADVNPLCVHGTRISGESRCECAQGYNGESCEVPVCHNYCLHGNCSVSAEGQPKCRCNPGYSGERCDLNVCQGHCFRGDCNASADGQPKCRCDPGYSGERCQVSACQESEPVCQCTGDYEGDSCNVSVCREYCLHGNCSTSAEGKPKCSCDAGYSGEQCELPACHGYCLNNGVCSLSEKSEPLCRCTGNYEGERCEFPGLRIKCSHTISVQLKDVLTTDVTSDKEVQSSCTSTAF